jgi:hypothetical protein
MTPSQLAIVDQALAEVGAQLDLYVTVYRRLRDKHGEAQAVADMCALFNGTPSVEVSAALAVAIARLANGGRP